jgi:hypothetical protein
MTLPEKRKNGPGIGGAARGYSWPPFKLGNQLPKTHGVYLKVFTVEQRGECEEIAESLREAIRPLFYSPSFEPLLAMVAARVWRWRSGYRWLAEHPEQGERMLRDLTALERTLQRDFADLGISPRHAAALGIDLQRLAAASAELPSFDLSKLSADERKQLSSLLDKGASA